MTESPEGWQKTKRKPPSAKEKLAAALLSIVRWDQATGTLTPLIDREQARTMTPEQIIHAFEFDHWPVPVSLGGTNHPTNLAPMLTQAHREKTAKRDAGEIARVRRSLKKRAKQNAAQRRFEEARREMLRDLPETDAARETGTRKTKWAKQSMPGSKTSGWKRTMRGKVLRRTSS
jgi:hypothetical protein